MQTITNKGSLQTKKARFGAAGLLLATATAAMWAIGGHAQAAVAGPTCNVPVDYATIQLAVDAPVCATVKVAAGIYGENVNVTRAVTIKGNKAGVSGTGRTYGAANESTVTGGGLAAFTINAPNVTIDGFSISNQNQLLGVIVKTAGDNVVIKNNVVDGVGNATMNAATVGIYLETGPDGVTIDDNKIANILSDRSAQGVLVGDSTSANPSLGIRITDNLIRDINSTSKGAYGVQFNNGASSAATATGYVTGRITDNTIKNLVSGGWIHAIGLEGDTPNVVVKRNTISNFTAVSPDKIGVYFEDNKYFFTADVNQNSLDVGNGAYGIAVNPGLVTLFPTLTADGTCNWWGNKSGPSLVGSGTGSHVSTGVDFKPWLKSSNINKDCDSNDYNDQRTGHGRDDKKRWSHWDD